MEWRLFATLAEAAGTRRVTVDAGPGDTFGDAFEQLLETHPELEAEVLDDDGEIRDHIRVLRNDHNPFVRDDGFDTVLEEGDDLALFPPVSGGQPRRGPGPRHADRTSRRRRTTGGDGRRAAGGR